MNIFLVILLVVVGVLLLLAEIFLLPGISLAGIAGIASVAGAVVLAYCKICPMAGHVTLTASLILCAIAIYVFIRRRTLEKMALNTDIDAKVDLLSDSDIQVGSRGIAISRLAPMGKVRIGNTDAEAKVNADFIDPQTEIEVVGIEGNTLIVEVAK